jgi:hypothetical protein
MNSEIAVQQPGEILRSPQEALLRAFNANPTPEMALQIVELEKASLENQVARTRFEWEAQNRNDIVAYSVAMSQFKDKVPVILRTRSIKDKEGNDKYKAVALEDVAGPLMKALSAHRITYRYKTVDLPDGRIRVTCILRLEGTAYEEEGATLAAPPDTAGGKDPLKAVGSTVSYLEKYTLLASCGVHVYGTDPEAVPVVGVSNEQAIEWIDAIRDAGTPEATMARWKEAIEVAQKQQPIDYKAMTIFTDARDERLKELRKVR